MKRLALAFSVVAVLLCTSCKGRTLDNVEPTGDTVEVTIEPTQTAQPTDTIN